MPVPKKLQQVSKAEGAAAGAGQIPGITQPLLYSEPVSVYRRFETRSVRGETERVQMTEPLRGHKRVGHVKGRAFDNLDANCVQHHTQTIKEDIDWKLS